LSQAAKILKPKRLQNSFSKKPTAYQEEEKQTNSWSKTKCVFFYPRQNGLKATKLQKMLSV